MSKRLDGIIGCKDKTSSWHLTSSSMVVTLGHRYNVGEKPAVILYTYINRHAGYETKSKNIQKQCSKSSNRVVIIYCFVGCKDETSSWHLNGFPDGSNIGSTV